MESKKSAAGGIAAELCEQADAEQDFEKLLQIASKLQMLIESRRKEKNSAMGRQNELPRLTLPNS
jgi:hypothetical protein